MINFYDESKKYFNTMLEIRRELHKHPELDRDLDFTASLVCRHLDSLDIRYKRFDNNGIVAEIGNRKDNIIALRADMDALEVVDLKSVPYKSQIQGLMHACGHDAHTAVQVGAAAILKQFEESLNGTVRLIFQPAEETDGGARDMIELGALEGVKAIIGLHVEESIEVGTVGVKRGVVSAASNPFKIKVYGKGAHGAYPETGIDSIHIASKIVDNLQGIVSREVSAVDSAVITIGKINGGTAANAICSCLTMEGILRTLGSELRSFAKERVKEVVEQTALIYRGRAEVEFTESYPSFENDDRLFNWFYNIASEFEHVNLIDIKKPGMGVEDFAYYTQGVPGLYYKLGCGNKKKGIVHPAHGSYFDIDEDCLIYGAAVQSMAAYNGLINGI
jgi:amidohydrolase